MKRFDFGDYLKWVCAIFFTGMALLLLWVLLIFGVLNLFIGPAEAAEADTVVTGGELEIPVATEYEPEVCFENTADPMEIDPEMLEQLAIGIYREGGGDAVCDQCRLRIGDVMLNRMADSRFPDTLADVLTQKGQYGTMYWDGITWPERSENPGEAHAVGRALETAEQLLRGHHSELFGQGYIFQSEFPELGEDATECCGIYYAKG